MCFTGQETISIEAEDLYILHEKNPKPFLAHRPHDMGGGPALAAEAIISWPTR